MTQSSITLNVIPLNIEKGSKRFSFYKNKPDGLTVFPLTTYEMPRNINEETSLFTNFKIDPEADLTLRVKFEQSPRFAKHYMNYRIYNWFENKARLRNQDFVRNNELYFLSEKDDDKNIAVFDRYRVRAGFGRITDGFELTVMYGGTMKVWLKPIYEYPGSSTDLKKVAYDGGVYRYEELIERRGADRKKVYPIINRHVAEELELPKSQWKQINKLKRYTDKIDWFYETWVQTSDFKDQFQPATKGYMTLPSEDFNRLDENSNNLLFGDGIIRRDPYSGMKDGGPYEPPPASHIELFIIVSENDTKSVANPFYNMLKNGAGHFPGLNKYGQIPVNLSENHVIFSDEDNPIPEIKANLQSRTFRDDIQYGAIYLSPIHKDDPDPEKHKVYYRVKEALLKYKVTSQVIFRDSVLDPSFAYYLPNIAVALIAKLGGTPWTLEQREKSELVIGIGAYSPNRFRKTYLGSAFCFSSSGDFRGFDSFTADDSLMLAGSFQKAVKQFAEENSGVERVVFHYYKRMSKKESGIILNALQELNLDVPVVVLTINKSDSNDLVLSDRDKSHRLPLSGTWMRSGARQFLLCNNTRFDQSDESIKSYPLPMKIYIDLAHSEAHQTWEEYTRRIEKHLNDPDWIKELLEQVVQFSRLNWQTVSIKNLPVTIRYPEMVARKFPFFDGDTIPEFGKRNFWFL